MASSPRPDVDLHDDDFFITYHGTGGAHALHGPYYYDTAQTLLGFAPPGATIVRSSAGLSKQFRFAAILLNYAAADGDVEDRRTALLAAGLTHVGSSVRSAVDAALRHVLSGLEPGADLRAVVDELVDAGFAPRT